MFPRPAIVMFIGALLFISSCADLPRDPNGTTKRVSDSGILRVGLIENPPWVIRNGDEPSGAEVELVKQFASSLGADPEWHWGGEEKLLGALEQYELDVVAGGISNTTPWSSRIGLSSPFFKERYDIGIPDGRPTPVEIRGTEIAVGSDKRLAGFVREEEAVPVDTVPLPNDRPVAAPEWKLQKLGLNPGGFGLHTDSHVLAVPPGENQLIRKIDEFMSAKRPEIAGMLQRQPEIVR